LTRIVDFAKEVLNTALKKGHEHGGPENSFEEFEEEL